MLGETLTGYIHRFYMRQRAGGGNEAGFPLGFVSQDVVRALEQQKKRGRIHPFLDLFLFDRELQRQGHSLLHLVGAILCEQQGQPLPFSGIEFLVEKAELLWGMDWRDRGRALLTPASTPDYELLLQNESLNY